MMLEVALLGIVLVLPSHEVILSCADILLKPHELGWQFNLNLIFAANLMS